MKRITSVLFAASLALAACGGSETTTETAPAPPPTQSETATEGTSDTTAPAGDTGTAETPAETGAPAEGGVQGGGAPAAQGEYEPTAEEQEKADTLVAAVGKMGEAVEANPDDCGALGQALVQVQMDNEAVFTWAETFAQDPNKGAWLQKQIMPEFTKIAGQLQGAAQKCQNDPQFQEAMKKLGGGM